MAQRKMLFVLGAGASKEVGLPTGEELKTKIVNILDINNPMSSGATIDDHLRVAMEIHRTNQAPETDIRQYYRACLAICEALPIAPSIDNYIHTHAGDKIIEACGKLAIVHAILSAERASELSTNFPERRTHIDLNSIADTWYAQFFKMIAGTCSKEELKERLSAITMVIFNYDRCFEHFVFNAFQIYYRITPAEASALVDCMSIYHPYGTVGPLPWQCTEKAIDFGMVPMAPQLFDGALKIRTFTEGTDPAESNISAIRQGVRHAVSDQFGPLLLSR